MFDEFVYVAVEACDVLSDFFFTPIPPGDLFEVLNLVGGESVVDQLGWDASHDCIGWHIFGDKGACTYDCTVSDFYVRHYRRASAYPYIIADYCWSTAAFLNLTPVYLIVCLTKEWKIGYVLVCVLSPDSYKGDIIAYGAVFADD